MNAATDTTSRTTAPGENSVGIRLRTGSGARSAAAVPPNATQRPGTARRIATCVGLLFLAATLTFAAGNALIQSYFSSATSPDGTLVAGVLLQGCTALAVAAIGLAMRRVLMPAAPVRSQAYLVLRLAESLALVAVGVYFLTSRDHWDAYALPVYVPSAAAGLVLSSALLTSRLVPRTLSALGVVGYAALLLAAACDLLGITALDSPAGYALTVPGGLFELGLPLLLLLRGFDQPHHSRAGGSAS